jgi:endonuclease/exonuclease/phosphatase family metal-dependent hydrolase
LITIMSVNAYNLYRKDTAEERRRHRQIEDMMASVDADLYAVQEIISEGADTAAKLPGAVAGLNRLARAVDRQCVIAGRPAVAVGGMVHHTGLLWRDGIRPLPKSLRTLNRDDDGMWHCAVSAIFDLGGHALRVGSVQLSPFDLSWSAMDVSQLLRVFNSGDTPGLLGGDFNCLGSDPELDPNPYLGLQWHPDYVYQLDDSGDVDRRPALRLESSLLGRMRDCVQLAGAKSIPTTGYHPDDNHPPRRIDRWYATHQVPAEAITAVTVLDADRVGTITDHRPVLVTVDETKLRSVRSPSHPPSTTTGPQR